MRANHRPRSGTTSAYAENTGSFTGLNAVMANYLRVRGEYWGDDQDEAIEVELPPRTRRIRCSRVESSSGIGTTSAYAENTLTRPARR